jgi:hypothetical protein
MGEELNEEMVRLTRRRRRRRRRSGKRRSRTMTTTMNEKESSGRVERRIETMTMMMLMMRGRVEDASNRLTHWISICCQVIVIELWRTATDGHRK